MLGQEAHVIFYANNKVRDSTQMNYSTMEKEFLAMLFTFLSFIPTIMATWTGRPRPNLASFIRNNSHPRPI